VGQAWMLIVVTATLAGPLNRSLHGFANTNPSPQKEKALVGSKDDIFGTEAAAGRK